MQEKEYTLVLKDNNNIFTNRQAEIVSRLCSGEPCSDRLIAAKFGISSHTLRAHIDGQGGDTPGTKGLFPIVEGICGKRPANKAGLIYKLLEKGILFQI